MHAQTIKSRWGRFLIAICSVAWCITGWWIIVSGGFTKSYRLSTTTTYVDGTPAMVMGFLFFFLSVMGAWVAVQSWNPSWLMYGLIAALIVGTPTIYIFVT